MNQLGSDPPVEAMKTVFIFAAEIWNASRSCERTVEKRRIAEITDKMAMALPELPRQEVEDLVTHMLGFSVIRYGEDPRVVVDIDVQCLGRNSFHVLAAGIHFN